MHQYAASDLFCCSNLGEQEASPLLCSLIFQLTVYIVSAPIIAWVTADAEILEKVCSGYFILPKGQGIQEGLSLPLSFPPSITQSLSLALNSKALNFD